MLKPTEGDWYALDEIDIVIAFDEAKDFTPHIGLPFFQSPLERLNSIGSIVFDVAQSLKRLTVHAIQ